MKKIHPSSLVFTAVGTSVGMHPPDASEQYSIWHNRVPEGRSPDFLSMDPRNPGTLYA